MPPPRCRNFNPNGTVRKPCSFGSRCGFVHPNDSEWKNALHSPYPELPVDRYRGSAPRDRDRDKSSSGSGGSRNNFASSSHTTDSGWGTTASQTHRKTSLATTKESVDHNWGSWGSSSNKSRHDTSGEKSPGHGWGSDTDRNVWGGPWGSSNNVPSGKQDRSGEKSPGHGWGSDADSDGWKSKSRGNPWGWEGADTSVTQSSSGNSEGWGSSSGAASQIRAKMSADGQPSGWGSNELGSTNTNAGGSETQLEPLDPPPRQPLPLPTYQKESGGWHTSTSDSHTLTLLSDPRPAQLISPAQEESSCWDTSKHTQPKVRDQRRPPQPLPVLRSSDKSLRSSPPPPSTVSSPLPPKKDSLPLRKPSNATFVAQSIDKRASHLPSPLTIKTTGIVAHDSLASGVPNSASSSGAPNSARPRNQTMTPAQIHTNTIRQAVRLHSELDDALADVERLKRLRASQQYYRATPATQTMFGEQRATYGLKAKTAESQLHANLKRLSELPQLTARADLESAEANEQELVEYSAQLRDWIEQIRAFYRPSSASEHKYEPFSSTIAERPKHPKQILWDSIEKSVESFDENIDFVEEILYSKKETSVDVASEIAAMRVTLEAQTLLERETKKANLTKEAKRLEMDVKDMLETASHMSNMIGEDAKVLAMLKQELEDCEAVNRQLASNIILFDAWKQEDASSIDQLRRQIKILHTVSRPMRSPFDLDALRSQTEETLVDHMRGEVIQLVNHIQESSRENSSVVIQEIFKQLDHILERTNEVCQRADAITAGLPHVLKPPNLVINPQLSYAARFAKAAGLSGGLQPPMPSF